jgi:hypothetical protein
MRAEIPCHGIRVAVINAHKADGNAKLCSHFGKVIQHFFQKVNV